MNPTFNYLPNLNENKPSLDKLFDASLPSLFNSNNFNKELGLDDLFSSNESLDDMTNSFAFNDLLSFAGASFGSNIYIDEQVNNQN